MAQESSYQRSKVWGDLITKNVSQKLHGHDYEMEVIDALHDFPLFK